jgi:hypothetical protein
MECFHCKGELVWSSAPLSVDRNGYHITWESIRAWVSTQCGEILFEENELHHIQLALEQLDRETKALATKVA